MIVWLYRHTCDLTTDHEVRRQLCIFRQKFMTLQLSLQSKLLPLSIFIVGSLTKVLLFLPATRVFISNSERKSQDCHLPFNFYSPCAVLCFSVWYIFCRCIFSHPCHNCCSLFGFAALFGVSETAYYVT